MLLEYLKMAFKYGIAGCPLMPVDNSKIDGTDTNRMIPKLIKKSTLNIYSIAIIIDNKITIGSKILYSIMPRNLEENL